jgi:lipopolysaccharide transport system ATP-binding protein
MKKKVLIVEDVSKMYRLGQVGSDSLRDDIKSLGRKLIGKGNPHELVGEENDRSKAGDSDYVWALKNVSFDVEQGEVFGIIGKNGAGKSTLLKILSRVTKPTSGQITIYGRSASLLEVGTGFHPELTGKENIYLNGAILGMRKHEIKSKFDEIVAFAGVERYINTPVKRYSSGMYVRLAFAVAAHLDPEILIVDEVLAVGDIEFQKKCLGKMKDVSRQEGRTVLFVSHNLTAVRQLCHRTLIMQHGKVLALGETNEKVNEYLASYSNLITEISYTPENAPGNDFVRFLKVGVYQDADNNENQGNFMINKEIKLLIQYEVLQEGNKFIHGASIYNEEENCIFSTHDVTSELKDAQREKGIYNAWVVVPANLLAEGRFFVSPALFKPSPLEIYAYEDRGLVFNVVDPMDGLSARGEYSQGFPGLVRPLLNWKAEKLR